MSDPQPHPVLSADEQVGVNGAIAAALTRWVGSMPALYVVLTVFGVWTVLATWGPLRQIDPFPFPFLLFLNNVVQLVLCLVILVGQRVLGLAADRRAVQTYEHAEAIFRQVADLQKHLDRHDRALSRGVSLLESSPHPWIERHRVQPPPQALDQTVSVNGRIAAWLTQRLGSVWAFYVAAGTQAVWIVLAETGVQHLDPYPFAFMSFLSTLAQLIFMIVIMVGQGVLGRAADRRSEQTFLDAEAILHECRRMKARLTAQDRVIDSLSDYTTALVVEQLAQAIHDNYRRAVRDAQMAAGVGGGTEARAGTAMPGPWEHLPEKRKAANRLQAQQIGEQLAAVGCVMVPTFDPSLGFAFDDDELELLARLEHERWLAERTAAQVGPKSGPDGSPHPDLVPWEQLSDEARSWTRQTVRRIPVMLSRVGFQVLRSGNGVQDGPQETDFTAGDWDTLQQALMATGVLVGLAEGEFEAEEKSALIKTLREASVTHPSQFIRELAAASTFTMGIEATTTYADYEESALGVIRSATAVVARTAPEQLADFREFLDEIAAAVADANKEGGFFGLGARRRTVKEATAMAAINTATGLADEQPPG